MNKLCSYFAVPPRFLDWIKMAVGAFLALCLIGYGLGLYRPSIAENVVNLFADYVVDLGADEAIGNGALLEILISNNLMAAFSSMACGMIPLLFLPAFSLGTNAMMVGLFAAYYQQIGAGLAIYLAGILPHGVFELFALCVSCACGLCLCEHLTDKIRRRADDIPFRNKVHDAFLIFVRIVFPLILLAALLETYVTPLVMNQFL